MNPQQQSYSVKKYRCASSGVVSYLAMNFTLQLKKKIITINYETHFHGLFEFVPDRGVEFYSIMENVEEDAMWHKGIVFQMKLHFIKQNL